MRTIFLQIFSRIIISKTGKKFLRYAHTLFNNVPVCLWRCCGMQCQARVLIIHRTCGFDWQGGAGRVIRGAHKTVWTLNASYLWVKGRNRPRVLPLFYKTNEPSPCSTSPCSKRNGHKYEIICLFDPNNSFSRSKYQPFRHCFFFMSGVELQITNNNHKIIGKDAVLCLGLS